MSKLTLNLPWTNNSYINIHPSANPASAFPADKGFELAKVVNSFADAAIYIGATLMFFWMAWGVFDYIRAEGNKEALAKARKRIQWAVVGFIILLASFFMSKFISDAFFANTTTNRIETLSRP